jgi:hypothetical protein
MAYRSIEETFQAIKPRRSQGIPDAPTIGVGVSSNGDLSTSLSQAGQQIAQLQAVYQQQAALITANTQAIQGNTSSQSGHSVTSTIGSAASGFLGGGGLLGGLLSPLISGIASLFGGNSAPAPLPIYVPPSPVAIDGSLHSATPSQTSAPSMYVPPVSTASSGASAGNSGGSSSGGTGQSAPTQVTVNVNAMDSQSFMDRSADIASAVREAMLNLHPINDVVANL